MNPPILNPEQYQKVAVYSFLASAPLLIGATMMTKGDDTLWEQFKMLGKTEIAHAQVSYSGPTGWTGNPNAGYSVSTPPPPPPPPPPCCQSSGDGDSDGGI